MKTLSVQLLAIAFASCIIATASTSGDGPALDHAAAIRGFESAAKTPFAGIPTDWTTRYVVFSTAPDATTPAQLRHEPRYWLDQLRKSNARATGTSVASTAAVARAESALASGNRAVRHAPLKRDWNEALGASTNMTSRPLYPAKFSFSLTGGTCTGSGSDFVVFTQANATAAQFNLIAYENLYVNNTGTGACAGTRPQAKFVYNASQSPQQPLGGEPVISLDGTRIAFIENQNNASSQAVFHVLLWREGDIPTANQPFPLPYNSADGATTPLADCATNGAVAPCEFSVTYSSSAPASGSSPYVDYGSDTAYVTDDRGHVLAIAPVFTATPTSPPAIVSGWGTAAAPAITTTGGIRLTPPVFDPVSLNVFVADVRGTLFYVRTTSASAGICATGSPPCLGATSLVVGTPSPGLTAAVVEPPLIDVVREKLFVFADGGAPGHSTGSYLVQTDPMLSSSVFAMLGAGTGTGRAVVPAGAFDNAYLTSSDGTGLIYGCGYGGDNFPRLVAFPVTAGQLGTVAQGGFPIAAAAAPCSPLTENFLSDTNNDLLFIGLQKSCVSGETTGCVLSYDITNGFPATSTPTAHTGVPDGTGGIIIDNATGADGANLYFSTFGAQVCRDYFDNPESNGECAISLTQIGLE